MIPHVTIRDAFGSDVADRLFAHAVTHGHLARAGTLGSAALRVDQTVRNALVVGGVRSFGAELDPVIDRLLPDVRARLGVGPFVPEAKQLSMVAYGDGAFYAKHIDTFVTPPAGHPLRHITFVYYFFREPKSFTGGELRLYDFFVKESVDLAPERDMLVAFPSWMTHEVLPVSCPGGAFADGRFAINIWVTGRAGGQRPDHGAAS